MRYGVPSMFPEDMLIALFLDRVPEEYRILQIELKYEFGQRNRDSLLLALKRREEELKGTSGHTQLPPHPVPTNGAPSLPLNTSKASKPSKPYVLLALMQPRRKLAHHAASLL